jgi:hypothetical protein
LGDVREGELRAMRTWLLCAWPHSGLLHVMDAGSVYVAVQCHIMHVPYATGVCAGLLTSTCAWSTHVLSATGREWWT